MALVCVSEADIDQAGRHNILRFGQPSRSGHADTAIQKLYLSHPAIDAQFGTRDEARLVA